MGTPETKSLLETDLKVLSKFRTVVFLDKKLNGAEVSLAPSRMWLYVADISLQNTATLPTLSRRF